MKTKLNHKSPQTSVEITLQRIRKGVESISDENRHKSISEMKCCVCGGKLHWSCYAEDSYSVECLGCELLFCE